MLSTLISLFVLVVVFGFVVYNVQHTVLLPSPWNVLAQVLAALIAILVLFDVLFGLGLTGLPPLQAH